MTENDFIDRRQDMVEGQIRKRGISDERVLTALRTIPRHIFVPENQRQFSYEDRPLPLGCGQTISQPYIVALMTEQLRVFARQRVLEVVTGSGYQAAVLAALGAQVFSIERISSLAETARVQLAALRYAVRIAVGDGTLGWPEYALYDRIIITAAAPAISPEWIKQLAIGGRLVLPVGGQAMQDLIVVTKNDTEHLHKEIVCGCMFVPLVGKYGFY